MFLAERYRCNSHILFQASGVSFLLGDGRPSDYVAVVSENSHVGSVVQVMFNLCSKDQFSSFTRNAYLVVNTYSIDYTLRRKLSV